MRYAIVLFLAGCISVQAPEPDETTAGKRIPKVCKTACANLRKLQCVGQNGSPGPDEKYGTADDVPCEDVCADSEATRSIYPALSIQPECLTEAASCWDADRCTRTAASWPSGRWSGWSG